MALVTEPIALDKSLNTTEQTSRNIADVLAEELSAIITAIGGLNFINFEVVQELPTTGISTTTIYLVPSDDPQSGNTYDEYINLNGTVSGWEKIGSTDIDLSGYYTSAEVDALLADKADVSDIPTVNDGTLTIQQNGETKGTFTANQSGNSTVNIEIPTTNIQTAVDEFETYNGGILDSLKVALSPIQDLSHGDPSPTNICPISGHTECVVEDMPKAEYEPFFEGVRNGTYGFVDLGSLDWIYASNYSLFYAYVAGAKFSGAQSFIGYDCACPKYVSRGDKTWNTFSDGEINVGSDTAGNKRPYVNIKDTAYSDTATFKSAMSGVYLIYELATPIAPSYTQAEYDALVKSFNGKSLTIPFGQTVYGGTLDVVSGVFTPDTADVDLGTLTWTYDSGTQRFTSSVTGLKNLPVRTAPMTCEVYKVIDDGRAMADAPDGSIYNGNMSSNLYVHDSRFTVPSDLATALSGYKLVYPLATPLTIQLSPTMVKALVGENHLSAPLEGQEITESKYKQMFTFDDVIAYIQSLS